MGSGILLLASCSGDLSALDPAGPSAGSIAHLWWVMLAGSILLFLLVVGLFLATVFVPRFGRSISPRNWIIGGGIFLPLPILLALTFYALWQGEYLLRGGGGFPLQSPLRVEAHGTMWQWRFSYPDIRGATPTSGTLHIPAGRTVEIRVSSSDVIHSFWVPRLAGKIDAIPGHTNYLRLRADRPGRYSGVCSEYCGTGHAGMRFVVQAHTQEDYLAALAEEGDR